MPQLSALWAKLRLSFYLLLSVSLPHQPHVRLFRFGLPFVLKATHRIQSTEADALSYLNTQFQGPHRLPIPRLYDSLVTDNCTYTLMSRIPGDTLLSVHRDMTDAELDVICHEVEDVMRRVWSLQQPAHFERRVCISASGHGILTVESHYESLAGPYRSSTEYYHINTGVWKDVDHFLTTVTPLSPYGDPRDVFEADPLVFTHTDLRMYNVMVKDGHLTGIIDWELSAWLPMEQQWDKLVGVDPPYWRSYWQQMDLGPATVNAHQLKKIAWKTIRALLKEASDAYARRMAEAGKDADHMYNALKDEQITIALEQAKEKDRDLGYS